MISLKESALSCYSEKLALHLQCNKYFTHHQTVTFLKSVNEDVTFTPIEV